MSTRAVNARHVRQRKLNTKQPLQIIRENEIEEVAEDELQRQIPQLETGVDKSEENEVHLRAIIHGSSVAALGMKAAKQSYIPTPDAAKAKDVNYDELYPKVFAQPATYIRFSSTVEDCIGVPYCMNDDDVEFLSKLNDGKDLDGKTRKDKMGQCSEDTFEEVMNFFEETHLRIQPFANTENPPISSLEEMEQSIDDSISPEAQSWLKPIYKYWAVQKKSRPLMPMIKVRVLDTSSDADDADPYICFRRREVRQTRKTRGRDAQVVEKLKKLRLELEQARQLVQMVVSREQLNKENLEASRKVFEQRRQLKEVKASRSIIGEKGEDEELLVNQKPVQKLKSRQDTGQRPPTIRLYAGGDRSATENDLRQLSDIQAETEAQILQTIENRKDQHRRWNQSWVDATWRPITPPLDADAQQQAPKWASLLPPGGPYPTPPPTLSAQSSRGQEEDDDEDVQMYDVLADQQDDATAGASPAPSYIFHIPGAFPRDASPSEQEEQPKRDPNPACRLRYGRGGRRWLEARKSRSRGELSRGVVSDSESEDESESYYAVDPLKIFNYRSWLNGRSRPDGVNNDRRTWSSGDQSNMMTRRDSASGQRPSSMPQQASAGGNGS